MREILVNVEISMRWIHFVDYHDNLCNRILIDFFHIDKSDIVKKEKNNNAKTL